MRPGLDRGVLIAAPRRLAAAATVAAAVAAALGLTSCTAAPEARRDGAARPSATLQHRRGQRRADEGAMAPAQAATTSSTTLEAPDQTTVGACPPAALTASVDVQPPDAPQPDNRTRALVVIASRATEPCTLSGQVATAPGPAGAAMAETDVGGTGRATVVVPARGSAFAGIEWSTAAVCPAWPDLTIRLAGGVDLRADVDVPAGTASTGLPVHMCGAVEVTPLQTTAYGAVTFPDASGSGLAACRASRLSARLRINRRAGGGDLATVTLADPASPCVLAGYVGVDLAGSGGSRLVLAVQQEGVAPPTVELSPGLPAVVTLQFFPALFLDKPDATPCASRVEVSLPGGAGDIDLGAPPRALCAGGVTIAPLEPAARSAPGSASS